MSSAFVIAGLDPAIHARVMPGHDGVKGTPT
jgi:hypothetical protein